MECLLCFHSDGFMGYQNKALYKLEESIDRYLSREGPVILNLAMRNFSKEIRNIWINDFWAIERNFKRLRRSQPSI